MGLGSILLILALLSLVALFVALPLLRDQRLGPGLDAERSHWIAERERALEALLELDFDYQLGKVPEEIFTEQRRSLLRQGAEALKRLEALAPADDPLSAEAGEGDRRAKAYTDAELEALIAKRKGQMR